MKSDWRKNIVKKCEKQDEDISTVVGHLEKIGATGTLFGAYYGHLLSQNLIKTKLSSVSSTAKVFQLCVAAALALPSVLVFFLISKNASPFLVLTLKFLVPGFLAGFNLFGVFDLVCLKLKLVSEELQLL